MLNRLYLNWVLVMNLLKKYWLTCFFCLSGIACLVSFNVIGSYVDENGLLIEPFALIPLSWFFQLLGLIAFLVKFFKTRNGS